MRRAISLLMLVMLVLTGCTLAAPKEPKFDSGTVRVLVLGGSGLESALTSAFQAANQGVQVESVQLPQGDDFHTIMEKVRSGELKVDTMVAPANAFLFDAGVVAPLDEQLKKYRIDLAPYGDAMELGKYDGKTYGLPVAVSPMLVVYNKELFKTAGLEEPKAGWTWEQFDQASLALAKVQAGKEKHWGAGIPPWVFVDLLITTGQGPMAADLKPLENTLSRFHQLMSVEKAIPSEAIGANEQDYYLAFSRGELGMLLSYWEYSFAHNRPTFEWSVAPMPVSKEGEPTPGNPTLAMVTSNAENQELAFAFARFAAGSTGAEAVVRMPGAPVPGYVNETVTNDWLAHAGLGADAGAMLKLKYLPPVPYPAEVMPLLLKEADAVLQGTKAADAAVRDYQQAREPFVSKK